MTAESRACIDGVPVDSASTRESMQDLAVALALRLNRLQFLPSKESQ